MTASPFEPVRFSAASTARALAPVCLLLAAVGPERTFEGAKWTETTVKVRLEPTGRRRAYGVMIVRPVR